LHWYEKDPINKSEVWKELGESGSGGVRKRWKNGKKGGGRQNKGTNWIMSTNLNRAGSERRKK